MSRILEVTWLTLAFDHMVMGRAGDGRYAFRR